MLAIAESCRVHSALIPFTPVSCPSVRHSCSYFSGKDTVRLSLTHPACLQASLLRRGSLSKEVSPPMVWCPIMRWLHLSLALLTLQHSHRPCCVYWGKECTCAGLVTPAPLRLHLMYAVARELCVMLRGLQAVDLHRMTCSTG